MRVSLFIPCFVDMLRPQIGIAMVNLFERLGHTVDYPEQTCCGQPAFNGGYSCEARKVAEKFIEWFRNAETIVVPSGSCAAMVKVFYPQLFEGSPLASEANAMAKRTFEFSEFLADQLGLEDVGAKLEGTATIHDGCHGLRELGIKSAPRKLLEHVRGLKVIEMDEAEACCGFGGTFSVKFPEVSSTMADVKIHSLERTDADYLVSNDPSCLMHLEGFMRKRGDKARCLHLAEVLAST